jgi:NAD-dependent SIR2 family protein deacetylase
MEPRCKTFALITQNVDGYHRHAGSINLSELADEFLQGKAGEILPALVDLLQSELFHPVAS